MVSEQGFGSCAPQTLKMGDNHENALVINPLYAMSARDDTGNKITHVTLRGTNYAECSKGFCNALAAKEKINFANNR